MKNKDIQNLKNTIENVEDIETVEQAETRVKKIKGEIRKLEIAVIAISLGVLSLVILPIIGIISFNIIVALVIIGGISLIFKALKDGEVLETERFFLKIILNQFNNNKDGESEVPTK
jgi:uncharacterized membrane protein